MFVTAQVIGRHGHDLGLEAQHAREHGGVQGVLPHVHLERALGHGGGLFAGVEHVGKCLAVTPLHIALAVVLEARKYVVTGGALGWDGKHGGILFVLIMDG